MNEPIRASVRNATRARCWIALWFLLGLAAAAAEPEWQGQLTSPKPGNWKPLAPCLLDFQLSWKGMLDSGTMRMEFAPKEIVKPGSLVIRSSSASRGTAALLFPYQSHSWSEVNPSTLRPKFFQSTEIDHRETVTTTNRYFSDRVESLEITKLHKKKSPTRNERSFHQRLVFDTFSAMLHIRSQKLANGDRVTLLTQPYATPYLITVRVVGREAHLGRKTIKLSVGMRKIDRKTLKLRPYKKMKRDATLWLSDDADRIPVEFRAAVFIGDVRATLNRFEKIKP